MRIVFLALFVSLALVGCRTAEPPPDADPDPDPDPTLNLVTLSIEAGHEDHVQFVAYQDGSDAWLELVPVEGEYTFEVTDEAGRYGVALVCYHSRPPEVPDLAPIVVHATTDELSELTLPCVDALNDAPEATSTITGTIDNPAVGRTHYASADFRMASAQDPAFEFTISSLRDGLRDVVVYLEDDDERVEELVIHHDVEVNGAGSVTVDFGDSMPLEAFDLTVHDATVGDEVSVGSWLVTKNGTWLSFPEVSASVTNSAHSTTYHAAPAPLLDAGDTQTLYVISDDEFGQLRVAERYFAGGSPVEVSLPAGDLQLTAAPVTPGAYPRYGATWQDLGATLTHIYFNFSTPEIDNGWMVFITPGWMSEGNYIIPDLSELDGWEDAWNVLEDDVIPSDSYTWLAASFSPLQPSMSYFTYWTLPHGGEVRYIENSLWLSDLEND